MKNLTKETEKNIEKQLQLSRKLKAACAVEELWPNIFDKGSCSSRIIKKKNKHIFVLINRDDKKKYFEIEDVPILLLHPHEKAIEPTIYRRIVGND